MNRTRGQRSVDHVKGVKTHFVFFVFFKGWTKLIDGPKHTILLASAVSFVESYARS